MIGAGLFRPRHSIILVFDKVNPPDTDEFFEKIEEVKKVYRFAKLSEAIEKPQKGYAVIAFENARKGAFLTVIPMLVAEKIPFNLFVSPEFIGTNRLPREEELEIYRKSCPEKSTLIEEAKNNKNLNLRELLGSFPVEKADPLHYFITWGKIKELPPTSLEIGIKEVNPFSFTDDIRFIEMQLKTKPQVAITDTKDAFSETKGAALGLKAVVTARGGTFDASTSPFHLPRFTLEKNN